MIGLTWIGLARADLEFIRVALAAFESSTPDRADEIERLSKRLTGQVPPNITVGVYGGLVQWVKGSPFPIRIVDYDGCGADLPDRDDEGLSCSIRNEPPQLPAATAS